MRQKQRWLVFYTRPRSEKKAEDKLQELGYDVLVPKAQEIRQWSDRKKKVIVPLFPGYLFALADEDRRISILETDEIVSNVKFGGELAELRPQEVENLSIIKQGPQFLEPVKTELPKTGAKVEVQEGPFKGLIGEVEDSRNETHVLVRIEAIGQAVRVKLPGSAISVVE